MFQSSGWLYQEIDSEGALRFPTVKPITIDNYSENESLSIAILKNFFQGMKQNIWRVKPLQTA